MSFPLDSDKDTVATKENNHRCSYCDREFKSYHGLGGHLRKHHHEIMIGRKRNHASTSLNSINSTSSRRTRPLLLSGSTETSFGGPARNVSESKGESSENNVADAQSSLIIPPGFSSTGNPNATSPSMAHLGVVTSTPTIYHPICTGSFSIPLDLPSNVCTIGNHQFKISDRVHLKKPIILAPMAPPQTQTLGPLGPHDDKRNSSCEILNKHCLGQAQGNITPKRPRIPADSLTCDERETPPKKELLPLRDAEYEENGEDLKFVSAKGKETAIGANGEGEKDLDLSLHL